MVSSCPARHPMGRPGGRAVRLGAPRLRLACGTGCFSTCLQIPSCQPPVTGLGVLFPPGWAFSLLLIQGFLHLWDAPQERELPQVLSHDQGCILPGLHDCSKIPSHPKLFWDMLGCVGSQTPVSPVCGIPPRLAVLCRGRVPLRTPQKHPECHQPHPIVGTTPCPWILPQTSSPGLCPAGRSWCLWRYFVIFSAFFPSRAGKPRSGFQFGCNCAVISPPGSGFTHDRGLCE